MERRGFLKGMGFGVAAVGAALVGKQVDAVESEFHKGKIKKGEVEIELHDPAALIPASGEIYHNYPPIGGQLKESIGVDAQGNVLINGRLASELEAEMKKKEEQETFIKELQNSLYKNLGGTEEGQPYTTPEEIRKAMHRRWQETRRKGEKTATVWAGHGRDGKGSVRHFFSNGEVRKEKLL
jgi:hypothetical protein